MTDAIDTAAIRARMAGLKDYNPGPWEYLESLRPNGEEWFGCSVMDERGNEFLAYEFDLNGDFEAISPTVRLIASAPEMHATIHTLCDALDEAQAENERLRAALKPFVSSWEIALASGQTSMAHLGAVARSETPASGFMRARAALAAKGQNEGDAVEKGVNLPEPAQKEG